MSKKYFRFLSLFFCLTLFLQGCAAPDFRGLKLSGEGEAREFVERGITKDSFLGSKDGVEAWASPDYFLGEISSFWVTVKNNGVKQIQTSNKFSTYTLVTKDGQKRELRPPLGQFTPEGNIIRPRGQGTFQIRLPRPKVRRQDVEMIICSFDLGNTQIFLFSNPAKYPKPTLIKK